ncbi:metallophosphoesterase [bacterium]|nr:metallophosphoesterase [bacterium]
MSWFILFCIVGLVACVYTFFYEPEMITVKHYKIKDAELKGLKIVFVSDFHLKKYQTKRFKKIINLINEQNADIVLSGGDYVALHNIDKTLSVETIAEGLSKIKSKYGFYTVLGNHDAGKAETDILKAFEKYSIKTLINNNVIVNIGSENLYIAGVRDIQTGRPNIFKALANTGNPVIFLTHNPDIYTVIPNNVNLILAGHTHGGQVRLPFLGGIIVPSKYKNKYALGLIEEDNKKMLVTKGIGTSVLNVRFNCKPEIVVIDFE